jgi:Ni,Fe-hydrogenase III large subunit/Ni,Fe-hydrogenase III component G
MSVLDLLEPGSAVSTARVDAGQLVAFSHELATEHNARLADLFGQRGEDGAIVQRVVYSLDRERRYLILECELASGRLAPISDLDPAAFVEECELYEQFGVRPDGHTRLNRVLVPPHGAGTFPVASGSGGNGVVHDYEPHVVTGEAFEFPFGPVRAAAWESLYMGLVTTGEEVLDIYLMHWHKHRGVERRLRGLDPERASFFAERCDGLSAVADTLAFCRAIEAARGVAVADAAERTRVIALELERVYNHTAALAATCQATGLSVGQARVEIVLERLLRLNAAAFGHRYLFGVVRPGGVTRAPQTDAIRGELTPILAEFQDVADGLLRTNSYVDRLESTGVITPEQAQRLSLVGPVARASGQEIDTRIDHPIGGGGTELGVAKLCSAEAGDVLARIMVMLAEVQESRLLIEHNLDAAGAARAVVGAGPGAALGWAESPRGEALAWVSLSSDGRIEHARLRPASVRNWRAFADAARSQNVFTDIPIIEASFWLTVSGFAR